MQSDDARDHPSRDADPRLSARPGLLAAAILTVEFVAGMQVYLSATIVPLLAAELDGRHLYGVATAAAQVALFCSLPLGTSLMRRFPPGRLLLWLTPVTVIAAVVSAVAPTMGVYMAGRVLAGLASGALATVSMGALVTGLAPRWRQLVLAGHNVTWIVSSLAGPVYAAWLSSALSWRWALVAYLTLVVVARVVLARALPAWTPTAEADHRLPCPPCTSGRAAWWRSWGTTCSAWTPPVSASCSWWAGWPGLRPACGPGCARRRVGASASGPALVSPSSPVVLRWEPPP